MNFKNKYRFAVIVVTVAMLIILPTLAYFQYIWLGQLSHQEYRRMQDNIRLAAFRCSMEFSREMTELMKSLGGPLEGNDEQAIAEMHDRFAEWKIIAAHPQLISKNIFIRKSTSDSDRIEIKFDEQSSLFFCKDFSAIEIPLEKRIGFAVVVPLDSQYVISLLHELIQSHFALYGKLDYDIIIADNDGNLFFTTNSGHQNADDNAIFPADIVVPFLRFPPIPLSFIPAGKLKLDQLFPNKPEDEKEFRDNMHEQKRLHEPDFSQRPEPPGNRERRMETVAFLELRIKHKDTTLEAIVDNNRIRNLAMSFGVLLFLGGSVIFLLISANRAQKLAQKQLEFVASVSHELRTPLAVLKSVGENLSDGIIHEKEHAQEYGDLIKSEVIRLSDMVERSLTYAGIQSGKQTYEAVPVNITTVLQKTIREIKKQNFNRCTIESIIQPRLPEISGDAAALQSAFENLLTNAIKYSDEKLWAGVEAKYIEDMKFPHIAIAITDRGIGISSTDIKNIFKPFYRGNNAVDNQIQGSGLGLNITQHVIQAHGGKISVTSSLNKGSTFTVQLPVTV